MPLNRTIPTFPCILVHDLSRPCDLLCIAYRSHPRILVRIRPRSKPSSFTLVPSRRCRSIQILYRLHSVTLPGQTSRSILSFARSLASSFASSLPTFPVRIVLVPSTLRDSASDARVTRPGISFFRSLVRSLVRSQSRPCRMKSLYFARCCVGVLVYCLRGTTF